MSEKSVTTIKLPKEVHRRLKHMAIDRDVSLRDLIWEAVEDFVEKHAGEKVHRLPRSREKAA